MDSKKAFDIIYDLLEANENDNYYIDFTPFTFSNKKYFELEEFLDKHYKKCFSKKVKFIAFSIIYNYKSYIFLDTNSAEPIYPNLMNKDLRNIGLDKLASIIDKMILDNYSALNILFRNGNSISLMRIEDSYDTYIFNLSDKEKVKIKDLIDHQGLFFKKL
ncbi:hypothetical protein [Lactobacillus ultunensis]|uniref:hypothetical protein n=1 Tax=Lactobacillus ultunensis TaxID=227945 RepID=UPI0019132120|nr:hypothetical protein [Lactobacillus ultunensis]QQP29463.1 hypothetical protein H4B44_05265 [Lactobacillus ultunensis]